MRIVLHLRWGDELVATAPMRRRIAGFDAIKRRIAAGEPDYWDWATLLELAVLQRDEAGSRTALGRALAAVREPWEPETTARNLRLIRAARAARQDDPPAWAEQAEEALTQAAHQASPSEP